MFCEYNDKQPFLSFYVELSKKEFILLSPALLSEILSTPNQFTF